MIIWPTRVEDFCTAFFIQLSIYSDTDPKEENGLVNQFCTVTNY